MKSVVTILFLFFATFSFAQLKNFNTSKSLEVTKASDFKISVSVDSAEDIESTFQLKDIKEILNEVIEGESISFEIICNSRETSNSDKSKVSYRVKGNSDDLKGFLKTIRKIRKGAINYYNNRQ